MEKKRAFLCSCCTRCLAVGSWYEGHWFCFWCHKQVSERAKVKQQHISTVKRKAVVVIEEIGNEL